MNPVTAKVGYMWMLADNYLCGEESGFSQPGMRNSMS